GFFRWIGLGKLDSNTLRKIGITISSETNTPLTYWMEMPLYDWSDWIESLTEFLEEKYKK
ncbi:MAG: hypothetical protein ACK5NU_17030, partial [Fusobacterium ulcerans]|uniref:hypothetical protein n=1 Tax=Fusobacterium ulcerans TaxID=861 RepID=UPI003A8C0BC2